MKQGILSNIHRCLFIQTKITEVKHEDQNRFWVGKHNKKVAKAKRNPLFRISRFCQTKSSDQSEEQKTKLLISSHPSL